MPLDTLRKHWGYSEFRPLQREIIDSVLAGNDTLGLLPTGGGKSLTFQVPALLLPGLTIVVTPLISLMKDQVDNLRARGIRAYALHSGMSRGESNLAMTRCRLGKVKMLYVSPERLQSQRFVDDIRQWDVSLIVVDESHCISQWGYDFRPSYLRIAELRKIFPGANVLALTASATPEVTADIMTRLEFRPGHRLFAKSFHRDNLSYVVRYDEYKERTLLRVLKGTAGSAIVYVRSRRRCRELAEMIAREGITAAYYHAGIAAEEKEEKQNDWKEDRVRVMVATNAFGMGIDKPDVRTVVHFDLPSSLEEYYQEAGRGGRDGKPSYAVAIVCNRDKATLSRRLSDSFPPKEYIRKVYELAGNFLEVSVGSGYNQVYEFNFPLFCSRFSLQQSAAHSALGILDKAGYISYIDEVATQSRAMIIAEKSEFYSLNLDPVTDEAFAALQRQYTGLFSDYVHISEPLIAQRAGLTEQQVYESMLRLSRMKVVSYVPKTSTPYIMYTTSREEPRHLLFPKAVYEDRKARMEARIDAVKRFAFDTSTCRAVTLLKYFGETGAGDCGQCDVCRSRKAKPSTSGTKALEERVRQMSHMPPQAIAGSFPPAQQEAVIEIIRQIRDSE